MNPALENLIRDHYREFQGYVSAGMESGKDESLIFMNANENPFELPGLEGYNRYPEPQPPKLLEAYARLYGVKTGQIVATRGADEAIVVLTRLLCEPERDSILTTPPTFGMYGVDAMAMPAGVIEVPLLKTDAGSFDLDLENIHKAVIDESNNIKMVFICSPNNPTGTSFSHADILRLCKELEGRAAVILDETYAEFSVQGSLAAQLETRPNLIILRTLSKSFSLAGMRMGTLLAGDTDFVQFIRSKCLDAYPLPKASIEAAIKVMEPGIQDVAKENRKKLLSERDRLTARFKDSPLVKHIFPTDANFFLMEMERAREFLDYCKANNIILRDFTTKALTENCIRVSAGTPEENDKLLTLLSSFEEGAQADSAA